MERSPRNRIRGFAKDTIEKYRDDEFRWLYRVYKDTARRFIQELESVAEQHNIAHLCKRKLHGGRPQIPLETKALMLLFFMASSCNYNIVATLFGVSNSTACDYVHAILKVMNQYMRDQLIKWPSEDEMEMITDSFYRSKGFRGVVGFIDGTHIPIRQPRERGMNYYNQKDLFSIILQGQQLTSQQENFNQVHSSIRVKVERAFGQLK